MTKRLTTWEKWFGVADPMRFELCPGASLSSLESAEQVLSLHLPIAYRAFMTMSNGALIRVQETSVDFYPIEICVELNAATVDPSVWPVLEIGRNVDEEGFGFLKSDLSESHESVPVYTFWHESGDIDRIEDRFEDLIKNLAHLSPNDSYLPVWERPHAPNARGQSR